MEPLFRCVVRIIFCILLLPYGTETFSQVQTTRFGQISEHEGLSQATVLCILQDSKGFLWFGTEDGLNRYDGYHFKVYRNEPGNPRSLSHSWVESMYEDKSGILWVGTRDGLNKFDRLTDSFVRFKRDPADPRTLSQQNVTCILEDGSGTLWIGTGGGGLDVFDRSANTFTHFKPDSSNPKAVSYRNITAIKEDRSGTLWIATGGGGLNKFDRSTSTFTHYSHDPSNSKSVSSNDITAIAEDHSGMLWIGTRDAGVNKLDPSTGTFIRFKNDPNDPSSLSHNEIWVNSTICVDHTGRVLIGTYGGGLDIFDPSTGGFKHFRNIPNNPSSLSNDHVMSIIEDKSGTVWIGTEDAGLSKIDPFANRFFHFENPESPASNHVWAVSEDHSGMLWIGTETEGVYRLNRVTKSYTHFKHDPRNSTSLSHDYIFSITEDKSGTLWIGSKGGLNKFDPSLNRFTSFKHDAKNPRSLSHNFVWCIYEDRSGTLWIGTTMGLDEFDRSTNTFKHLDGVPSDPVFSLCEDSFGSLWIGIFGKGLYKLDRPSNKFIHFENDPNNPQSISGNDVLSIYEAKDGTLWIGTYSGGINKFVRSNGSFVSFTTKDGLPTNSILAVLGEDSKGNLWFGTMIGVSRFDPRTAKFMNFDASNGLEGPCNQGAYHKDQRGEIFLGSSHGINWFYPDSILGENQFVAPIVITEFRLFNRPVYHDLSELRQIELSYADNFFSFEFALLDFSKSAKNQYAYKMEGFNSDWVSSGSERLATFTHLDPGEYTFRVKGSNGDRVWNEEGTSVRITITPPWWKTWWFQVTTGLALAIAFGGSVRQLSTRTLRKRVAELHQAQVLEAERSRISKNMHDDLGARLTELSMGIELLKRGLDDRAVAEREVQKMSDATREIVGTFDEIVWTVNPENDTLENVATALGHYASKYLSNAQIRCRLDIPTILPERRIPADTRHNILMVVKEAIHNIVKHACATEVSLQVSVKDSLLEATVRDNGKGFVLDSVSPFSDGLKNMKKRMEDVGGKFEVVSEINKGTEIKIAVRLEEG